MKKMSLTWGYINSNSIEGYIVCSRCSVYTKVSCSLVCFSFFWLGFLRLVFSLDFRLNVLHNLKKGNLFGHTNIEKCFRCFGPYKTSSSVYSIFKFVKRHARLSCEGQDRKNIRAKDGFLDRLTRVQLIRYELCLVSKVTIKPFGVTPGLLSPSLSRFISL